MGQDLANFCRQRAQQCREASERAPTGALRSYWLGVEFRWRHAEAEWRRRFPAPKPPAEAEADAKNLGQSSQEEPIPLSSTTAQTNARAVNFERFRKWFEMVQANLPMRDSESSPEELARYREQALACQKAADSAENVDAREYWLVAEAHWLSLANGSKSPSGAD
jgi:hypothetical protein